MFLQSSVWVLQKHRGKQDKLPGEFQGGGGIFRLAFKDAFGERAMQVERTAG